MTISNKKKILFVIIVSPIVILAIAVIILSKNIKYNLNEEISHDGEETAVVYPSASVEAGSSHTWKITYTVGKSGIAKDGGVVLQISPWWGWSPPQNFSPSLPGYTKIDPEANNARIELFTNPAQLYALAVVKKGSLKAGEKITFIYGAVEEEEGSTGKARADTFAEKGEIFLIKTDANGDGSFSPITESPKIDIVGGKATRLLVTAPSVVMSGEAFDVSVSLLDAYGNRASSYVGKIKIDAYGPPVKMHNQVTFEPSNEGAVSFTVIVSSGGILKLQAVDESGYLKTVSNPIIVLEKKPTHFLYFADLHGHSQLSDGTGTPHDFYKYAKEVARLDAAAVTDHDHWGFFPLDEYPDRWEFIKEATETFYVPGRFVTFLGYEFTDWEEGHYTVIFPHDGALISSANTATDTPTKLWKALSGRKTLTIPHHSGGGPVATDWGYYDSRYVRLVEIVSVHGVSETIDNPAAIYNPKPGHFVIDALARGYKMGFMGSGDSHNGHPGVRDIRSMTGGITGIWATDLTREGLWEALTARRTFATTGARICLEFGVNDAFMGEELHLKKSGESRKVRVRVIGTAPIELIEIIKNGTLLASRRHYSETVEFEYNDHGSAQNGDYYYVRVTQSDKEMAWSSPVWLILP